MIVVGIDPGKKGALVALDSKTDRAWAHLLKYDKLGVTDWRPIASGLGNHHDTLFIVERVIGRGGWSARANFSFGLTYGQVMLSLRHHHSESPSRIIGPLTWQQTMHRGLPDVDTKSRSLLAFEQLFPYGPLPRGQTGKMNENLIDAWLIAAYGVLSFTKERELRRWVITKEESHVRRA